MAQEINYDPEKYQPGQFNNEQASWGFDERARRVTLVGEGGTALIGTANPLPVEVTVALNPLNFTGNDCTGADKSTGRTLDIGSGNNPKLIVLEREFLHPNIDYTVSGSTITFLVKVFNKMRITVWY